MATGRILLVEDNDINQRIARLTLTRVGHTVDGAWNGTQAVEACRAHDYDIVLMDCQMPEMDGLEATRQIRKLNKQQPTIIALTAHALANDRQECLTAGMDGYLAKPYRGEQLLRVVQDGLLARC
jgi:CheY-like chemotaxis protein